MRKQAGLPVLIRFVVLGIKFIGKSLLTFFDEGNLSWNRLLSNNGENCYRQEWKYLFKTFNFLISPTCPPGLYELT